MYWVRPESDIFDELLMWMDGETICVNYLYALNIYTTVECLCYRADDENRYIYVCDFTRFIVY